MNNKILYDNNPNIPKDRDIVKMSPSIQTGMRFKSFFGLYGSLPMAFTDRILSLSNSEYVMQFFDEVFADFLVQKEVNYYKTTHRYIQMFRKPAIKENNCIKMIKIHQNYNKIGVSKLNYFILGDKSPVQFNKNNNFSIKLL